MGDEEGAGAVFGFGVSQMCFYAFGYIYYLIFLLCCDGDRFHGGSCFSTSSSYSIKVGITVGPHHGLCTGLTSHFIVVALYRSPYYLAMLHYQYHSPAKSTIRYESVDDSYSTTD